MKSNIRITALTEACKGSFSRILPKNYEVTTDLVVGKTDLLLLPGSGYDVNFWWEGMRKYIRFRIPKLHPHTNPAPPEIMSTFVDAVTTAQENNIPVVGVCFGAQVLCAMNGGTLYQHCDNHAHSRGHEITTVFPGFERTRVSSTHHQMMRVVDTRHELLGWANRVSSTRQLEREGRVNFEEGMPEPEIVFFPDTQHLAVQFHPEYDLGDKQVHLFLHLIDLLIAGEL